MKNLIRLAFLFCCLPVFGAGVERISLVVTVTNIPVTSNTLTVNSTTRTWTNISSSSFILTNLSGVGPSTTNLANNLASFPISGPLTFEWLGTNSFRLRASIGGSLSASSSGNWCTLTFSTQAGPQTLTALWPMENMPGDATNRTNQASSLVHGMGLFSNEAFPTNATAVSNHLHKGAGPRQRVISEVEYQTLLAARFAQLTNANLVNSTNSGIVGAFTNGYWTNATLSSPKTTNLINYGNAISSPGTNGSSSQQFGAGALATNNFSTANGASATAIGVSSSAFGFSSVASGDSSSALGAGAEAPGANATAIGAPSSAVGANSTAVGAGSTVTHQNATVIGYGVSSAQSNEVRAGSATIMTSIGGMLIVEGTQTNTVHTGTNVFTLAISHSVTNITTLANGVNLVDPGFKTYIVVSGPSAGYSLDKLTRGYDGRWIEIEKQDSFTLTIADESGSGGGAATDRIRTGTGGNITLTNNPGSFGLRYNAALGRWVLKWKTN